MTINQILSSRNPQQLAMNMLQEEASNNSVLSNLLQLAQNGNAQAIEQIARNIVSERGLDYDTEFNKFKQQFGIK